LNKKPESLKSNSKICPIDPARPDHRLIDEAVDIVKSGGIVIFPTRTLYGMGADAFKPDAVNRIYAVKHRPAKNPLSVLVKSIHQVETLAAEIPETAIRLMEKFWPGRLTVVFSARPEVPSGLTAGTGKIGIRVPEHPVAVRLIESLDVPLTATSANLSGQSGADCVYSLPDQLIRQINLVLDAGKLKGGIGSTVVDVTVHPPVILREGAVSARELFAALQLQEKK
jgi:L-threonylcarbamoyladenylate synthase